MGTIELQILSLLSCAPGQLNLSRRLDELQDSFRKSDERVVVRATSVNMVLGTDMKKHFDIMSRFQVMKDNGLGIATKLAAW